MKFTELTLRGAFLIESQPHVDDRGYFARTFCINEFKSQGLVFKIVQCSSSFNLKKGLIRGMHYQAAPFQETKIVRCTRGSIFDVIIDLRKNSPTYQQWTGIELSAENNKMLYIPKDFAHGYQVLENHSEVLYMMDEFYYPESAREISTDSIHWPLAPKMSAIS